jgi:OmpA-OmpF porin, OOP family
MIGRSVVGKAALCAALAACSSRHAAAPSASSGRDSPEALARDALAVLTSRDVAARRSLMPPPTLIAELCDGEPAPILAELDRAAAVDDEAIELLSAATLELVAVDEPAAGSDRRLALAAGAPWPGPWPESTCALRRSVEIVKLEMTARATQGAETAENKGPITALLVDGRWFLVPEPPPARVAEVAPVTSGVFEVTGNELRTEPIAFDANASSLQPHGKAALQHVVDYLAAKPFVTALRIESHVHPGASAAADDTLTMERAAAVAAWLVAQGVDCKRVLPVGFGSSKPIADNSTQDGRFANDRIVFVNAALDGRPIGGAPLDGGGRVAGDPCQ